MTQVSFLLHPLFSVSPKRPRWQISFADLPIDAESAGLFTQLNGSHPRYFSGLLDVGTMSPNCESHQVFSHCELLLECCCQLLTGLKGKGTIGIMVVDSQNTRFRLSDTLYNFSTKKKKNV